MRASVAAARWEGLLYGVTPGASSVGFLALVALVAGQRALDGDLTIGELVAVVGLAQFVAEPMGMLAYLVAQLARRARRRDGSSSSSPTPPLVAVGDADARRRAGLAVDARRRPARSRTVTSPSSPVELVAVVRRATRPTPPR